MKRQGTDKAGHAPHAYPVCHREERSAVAISFPAAVFLAPTRLPRFARNDGSSLAPIHRKDEGVGTVKG